MDKEIMEMLEVQGEVRLKLMRRGLNAPEALEAAASVFELLADSNIMKEEHKASYKRLMEEKKVEA